MSLKHLLDSCDYLAIQESWNQSDDLKRKSILLHAEQFSALQHAVKQKQYQCVRVLLNIGYYPNHQDMFGKTALSYAISNNLIAITSLLLDNGADLDEEEDLDGVKNDATKVIAIYQKTTD
ncbi:hypothetical protein GEMRC1_007165 [Eukaryota sp. GEM-RC1]